MTSAVVGQSFQIQLDGVPGGPAVPVPQKTRWVNSSPEVVSMVVGEAGNTTNPRTVTVTALKRGSATITCFCMPAGMPIAPENEIAVADIVTVRQPNIYVLSNNAVPVP